MTGYAPSHLVPLIERSVRDTHKAGLIMQTADDAEYVGRYVQIEGRSLLNFGGCSYLGLEQRPELKDAAIAAIRRYGTQFSFSRAYLQSPLYERLETALTAMTGGFPLVTPSTTLAHISALPVLVAPGDAVLIDLAAHASLHTATGLLGGAIPVASMPHNDITRLDHKIARLATKHRRVWLMLDGLYSMHGDFAPLDEVNLLLQKHPSLHIYIDDAHSTSWLGKHGRGWALDVLADRSRVYVALSLNKAFSAGGGALIFPDAETRTMVRRCGGPMLFSGPVQPPMLGAAVASAEIHLRSDFSNLQRMLHERIGLVRTYAQDLGIHFSRDADSPIFFVRCGALESTLALGRTLRMQGLYTCPGVFPAVPRDGTGLRFTLSLHNTEADVRYLLEVLAAEMKRIADGSESGTIAIHEGDLEAPSERDVG